jgi:hypothetical protein
MPPGAASRTQITLTLWLFMRLQKGWRGNCKPGKRWLSPIEHESYPRRIDGEYSDVFLVIEVITDQYSNKNLETTKFTFDTATVVL